MKKILVSAIIVTRNRSTAALKAIDSMYKQSYKHLEVILVDNGSGVSVGDIIKRKYPKTKIIVSKRNLGAAGGRNLGLANAQGGYALFMDDDAFADKNMILELVKVMEEDFKIGIVQPKIYDANKKNTIQGIGHDVNLLTGRVLGIGVGEKDHGQYNKIIDIPMVGCTWMVRKKVFNKIGNYDENFFIPYEDSDFSLRARRAGFKICFIPNAIVWHDSHKDSDIPVRLQWLGITTLDRAFRISRNKIIFMKKHAPFYNLLIFLLVFTPIYTLIHSVIILLSKRFDVLIVYWKGLLSGYYYVLTK